MYLFISYLLVSYLPRFFNISIQKRPPFSQALSVECCLALIRQCWYCGAAQERRLDAHGDARKNYEPQKLILVTLHMCLTGFLYMYAGRENTTLVKEGLENKTFRPNVCVC